MGRSEDYLDSLLDSLNEPKKAKDLDLIESEAPKKRTPDSEASYLDAFERELEEEFGDDASDFLRDFEREIFESDLDLDSDDSTAGNDILSEDASVNAFENAPVNASDTVSDNDVSDVKTNESDESDDSDDISDIIGAAFGEDPGESESRSPIETEKESAEEEDEDFISDIEDGEPEADAGSESDDNGESGENGEGEADEPESSETETEGSDDTLSQDEIMDIGDLLNSIDEEGNLAENETETKPGEAVDADADASEAPGEGSASGSADTSGSEEKPEEDGKKKKMPGFLAKIIAILFSTGEEKEGEEEKENPEEEKGEAIDEEPPIDKKQAKKEEKERKKKEKEEAKKKAKEEKEKKAKEKPPKAPKQKKPKVPDNSPKIPLIAILAFVLLSASMVVLWFVTEKTVSHSLFVNGAKSSFDHQEYMDAYKKLSGVDEFDEDGLILYNRAKIMAMLEYRINQYEIYVEKGEHINAIDALVRGAYYYNSHQKEASEMGIPSEYDALGHTITERLETVYGLSIQDAKDLMALRDRKTYTRELYRILEREGLWSYEKR